jgi:hypothetical protein
VPRSVSSPSGVRIAVPEWAVKLLEGALSSSARP